MVACSVDFLRLFARRWNLREASAESTRAERNDGAVLRRGRVQFRRQTSND
jgi:hypothetical protein